MKHPYTLQNLRETNVIQYDGIGWLASDIEHFADSSQIEIDGKFYEFNQKDLNGAFKQIVEDRISGDLHDQHFQEVLEDTIVGWDWILRYVLSGKGMTILGA